jgi:hypothetical protein
MKKITLIAIAIFAFNFVWAQAGQQNRSTDFLNFYEEVIKPDIKNAQDDFFSVLTKSEIKELKVISLKRDELFNEAMNKNRGNRYLIRDEIMNLRDEARIIANAHPEQSEIYRNFIQDKSEIWINEMPSRNQGMGRGRGMNNNSNYNFPFLTNMKDPAWLLLWNQDKDLAMFKQYNQNYGQYNNQNYGRGQGRRQMQGQRGQGRGQYCQRGMQNYQRGMRNYQTTNNTGFYGRRNIMQNDPELWNEVQNYAIKNILPFIADERKLFDEKLSQTEIDQITLAREKIKDRQEMYKNWSEDDDFQPGARRNDPEFDNLRNDMQISMNQIRQIALDHSNELAVIKSYLTPELDKWRTDIVEILDRNNLDRQNADNTFTTEYRKSITPIAFLLFDPENLESSKLFGINKR